MATTRQVAEFYEVKVTVINNLLSRHRKEIESDGMDLLTRLNVAERLKTHNEFIEITPQVATIEDEKGNEYKFTNRGSMVFPRRTILRVGMLLRDSSVQYINVINFIYSQKSENTLFSVKGL